MELLWKRPSYDIFKFQGIKKNRYGRSPAMDFIVIKTRRTTYNKSIKKEFISEELLVRYCKLIGNKYPDHRCSKCNGEDNVIPDVDLE